MTTENILYGGYEGSEKTICDGSKSFGEFLLKKLKNIGDYVLFVDGITDEHFTAIDVYRRTIRLAECLQYKYNIKSGDVVSISSENRIEFALIAFATISLGATLAPLNTTYTEREIHHAVNLSRPKIIFVTKPNLEKVAKINKQNKFIERIILIDNIPIIFAFGEKVITFNQLVGDTSIRTFGEFQCQPQNMRENVSLILCSSGTTGLPKGVQLTEYGIIVADVQHYERPRQIETDVAPIEIMTGILPWFHAFGCLTLFINAMRRARVVFLPKFQEEPFLRSIEKHKINTAYIVPPLMVYLSKNALVDKYNLTSLQVIWCGAAPLSKEVEDAVRARIGIPVIRQGYGMTEGTLAFTGQTDDFHKSGSVGVIRKGTWGKIVDTETGAVLGPHGQGELCFKATTIMKGYVGDQLATSATIDKDGWLHTGDIGYYDENREFFIVDRIKELIKYKAFQVPPAEIEAVLLTHSGVKDVGVIGVPDEDAGELAFAFVVSQPNTNLNREEIIKYVADRVSPPKQLHGGVVFINEIPKNASGKILRRVLREMVQAQKSKL